MLSAQSSMAFQDPCIRFIHGPHVDHDIRSKVAQGNRRMRQVPVNVPNPIGQLGLVFPTVEDRDLMA